MLSILAAIETEFDAILREIDRASVAPQGNAAPAIQAGIDRVMARIAAEVDRAPLTARADLLRRMAAPFRDRPAVISDQCRFAIERLGEANAREAATSFAVFREEVTTFFLDDEDED